MITIYHKITDHFDWDNFSCPHCGLLYITKRFYGHIEKLESIRLRLNFPLIVNSAQRCEIHNAEVGGETNSQHLIFATDVTPEFTHDDTHSSWIAKLKSLQSEFYTTFDGVGFYDNFVHGDLRGSKAFWDNRTKKDS